MIWTQYLSSDFALFIALAILLKERDHLINPKYDFSDILQVITIYTVSSIAPAQYLLCSFQCGYPSLFLPLSFPFLSLSPTLSPPSISIPLPRVCLLHLCLSWLKCFVVSLVVALTYPRTSSHWWSSHSLKDYHQTVFLRSTPTP